MDKIDDLAHQITQDLIRSVHKAWKTSVPSGHMTTKQFHQAVERALKLYKHLESDGDIIPDWPPE